MSETSRAFARQWLSELMGQAAGYVAVFLAAATPWVEILFVVPAGVVAGLHPVGVGIVAFAGNAIPVVAIVLGGDRLMNWWERRRGTGGGDSRRTRRARRLLQRYGVPGLALLGPLLTGAHLAALVATMLRPRRVRVISWMCGGLAGWTVGLTVLSVVGVDLVRG